MSIFKIFYKTSLFSAALAATLFTFAPAAQASSLSTNWNMASIWEGPGGELASHSPLQSRANTSTADGRLTVFWALANNLVPGDTNNASDIFIFDRITKMTQRVNIGAGNTEGNGHTRNATISADGRYIGFTTLATNTAAGPQCIPGHDCAFSGVLDRTTGAITVASKDNSTGQLMPVTLGVRPIVTMHPAIISGDGHSFLFSVTSQTATDQTPDIFVRNLITGVVTQANVKNNGQPSDKGALDPSISDDGRFVVFSSMVILTPDANGTFDVFMRDMVQGTTKLVSHAHQSRTTANDGSQSAKISGNGQLIVFKSFASNLVAGGNLGNGSIFLYDRQTDTTRQIMARRGEQPNDSSSYPSISADGSHITFMSNASNFTHADTRDIDMFLHYTRALITRKIKLPPRTDVEMTLMGTPVINADGKAISYLFYTRSPINPALNSYGASLNYDPVSHIPFYDPGDIVDIF
ncbi:MAG TPA: hypothetical protein VFT87_03850 [Candidatus Saccharimonadales bacterium]|nr:hypothetical protein [Candidatus Saccharimonadales bacterium]